MANIEDLKCAVAKAEGILKEINQKYSVKESYPRVKMYLVFSSHLGQTGMGGSVETTLKEFPEMLEDDEWIRKPARR